jgi:hypothetical protein
MQLLFFFFVPLVLFLLVVDIFVNGQEENESIPPAAAAAATSSIEQNDVNPLLRKRQRELRQSFFCRCVADYENFYDRRLTSATSSSSSSLEQLHHGNAEKSERVLPSTETKTVSSVIGKYYRPAYSQQTDAQISKDGFYIVQGITVLPLGNEACIASQTNKALRFFLEVFFAPNANGSARKYWSLFTGNGKKLLRRLAAWDDRRKKQEAMWEQDLSQGTQYEASMREVPRIFPCPPEAAPPSPAPTTRTGSFMPVRSDAPSNTPTKQGSPTVSDMPSLQPTAKIIAASEQPSTSAAPTVSKVPTVSPANIGGPTASPSAAPLMSAQPTVSAVPTSSSVPTVVAGTVAPTASSAPTLSMIPSASPSVSSQPTASAAPSATGSNGPTQNPSISSQPTASVAPNAQPTVSQFPTVSSAPTSSAQPSTSPTISSMPTISAAPSVTPTISSRPTVTSLPTVNAPTLNTIGTDGTGSSNIFAAASPPELAKNIVCGSAEPLAINESVLGSTKRAIAWRELSCSHSGGVDNNQSPTAWFEVTGTGQNLEVSTCFPRTNFASALQVEFGACHNLTCLPNSGSMSDMSCSNTLASKVVWNSIKGQKYKVLLFGRQVQSSGEYELILRSVV